MNIGQKILFELKKEISELEYERYIKKLVYDTKRSRSNMVFFSAPNLLVAKWVKTKYTDKLIHLFDPLISTPTTRVNKRRTIETRNR